MKLLIEIIGMFAFGCAMAFIFYIIFWYLHGFINEIIKDLKKWKN